MVYTPLGIRTLFLLVIAASTASANTPSWGSSGRHLSNRARHVELGKRALPSGWPSTSRCVVDSANSRVLSTMVRSSTSLTVDICVGLCNTGGYKYAGMEYAKECWCGNSLNPSSPPTSTSCNMPCGGNTNQNCGGGNALRLFTKTPTSTSSQKATSTSSKKASTSSASSTSYAKPKSVFPEPIKDGWSVAKFAPGQSVDHLRKLTLSGSTLVVKKEAKGSSRPVVDVHGKKAIKAHMVKGQLTPGTTPYGGFSFYTFGPAGSSSTLPLVDLKKGKEVLFSYSIYFQSGFDFNIGGKLPGLYGGTTEDIATTCSGGDHDPRCFSARLMFREGGAGELYLYIPQKTNNNDSTCGPNGDEVCVGDPYCGPSGHELCGTMYGNSAGRGNWHWKPGQWQTVSQRILLNTPGVADGEAEVYVDGVSVLLVKKVTWRKEAASVVRGAMMQIFFGGHTDMWRCPKDQDAFFADISAGIIR